jgi:hypothetical protein
MRIHPLRSLEHTTEVSGTTSGPSYGIVLRARILENVQKTAEY